MSWVAALFVLVAFLVLVRVLRIPDRTTQIMRRGRLAAADLKNPKLDEREKERAVQAHAVRMFLMFLVISGCFLVALAVPLGIVALLELGGVVDSQAVLEVSVSWEFLIVALVIGIGVLAYRRGSG